ncbi:ARP8 [Malassezia furfur]|nr:ARP8 [Malassezia furfur]
MPRVRRTAHPDVSSSYLKTEAQTWMSRKRKADDDDDAAHCLVIHLGSEHVRVGRSSDLYPTTVPCALARRMRVRSDAAQAPPAPFPRTDTPAEARADDALGTPEAEAAAATHADPVARHSERLRAELRAIMRQYKLRPVSNGWQSANSYNASVTPERVLEHNDVYHLGRRCASPPVARRRADAAPAGDAPAWELFRPWRRGMLDVARYHAAYGASAGVHALLNDLQHILTHALCAPPADDAADDTLASPGLGILAADLRHYSVLLLVPDAFSRADLRALGTLLLTQMGFAALNVQTEGLCAMFGAGLSAACIVDLGATSIGVSCVEEGLVLPETRISLAYGGQDVSLFFGEVLRRSHFPYHALDASARLADRALLDSLKERFATLLPNQVGLNLYDFVVRLPHTPATKYALRVYDEPILAGLLLFHPEAIARASLAFPRRAASSAALPAARSAEELESITNPVNTNASLGGDEAVELQTDTPSDVTPTLAIPAPGATEAEAAAPKDTPKPAPAAPVYTSQAQRGVRAAAAVAAQDGVEVVGDASRTPLDYAVFRSLLASTGTLQGQLSGAGNEERLRKLANNIMCIGGTARLAGLGEALEARVSMLLAEHYTPSDPARAPAVSVGPNFAAPQATVIPPPRNMEPEHLAWKGLAVLAHLDAMQELWVCAADWDTFGYRALKEKSLFL